MVFNEEDLDSDEYRQFYQKAYDDGYTLGFERGQVHAHAMIREAKNVARKLRKQKKQ